MPLDTLHISGPARGGKSTLAQLIATQVVSRPVHYLRMQPAADGHTNAVVPMQTVDNSPLGNGWGSAFDVTYTADRVFETVPEGLRVVRKIDRCGFAVIEAGSDPALRHAYPYDYRIFLMRPADVHEVFRNSREAAKALQEVMQDTAAFASEIFGLFDDGALDDSAGVEHRRQSTGSRHEQFEELNVGEAQIRQFLHSPLGVEIASRIQLQPEYHAIVEADVVVINTGMGGDRAAIKECVQRIEKLLARVRHTTRRHSVLYWGDIRDVGDPTHHGLLRRLRTLFSD